MRLWKKAKFISNDSRQEWNEEYYKCSCGKAFVRRIEYDQNGLITYDKITDE